MLLAQQVKRVRKRDEKVILSTPSFLPSSTSALALPGRTFAHGVQIRSEILQLERQQLHIHRD